MSLLTTILHNIIKLLQLSLLIITGYCVVPVVSQRVGEEDSIIIDKT